ncbi:MAG: rhomboid family intramembrane serine protease [Actinomycetota bacterium]|nr:rhomboid family intramembrane serine protease [Actinomycetota bacterium]
MEDEAPDQGWITKTEYCYRHPSEPTRVHCTRCNRPICTDCMIPAPVGYQCPECVAEARQAFRRRPSVRAGARSVRSTSMTKALLLVLVAVFVVEIIKSGGRTPTGRTLFDMGALFPPAVAQGQWWRLVTVMFLHANIIHIAFNAWALWIFGQYVESLFGRWQFLMVFFVSAFIGSVASYAFGPVQELGVGASGGIVGLLGAFIAYNLRRRHLAIAQAQLRWVLIIILLNVFLTIGGGGFGIGNIDWRAHLGGLVGGFVVGGALEGVGPRRYHALVRVGGVVGLIVLVIAVAAWRTGQLHAQFPQLG